MAQVSERQGQRLGLGDELQGLAINFQESSAQTLMAAHDLGESALKSGDIKRGGEVHSHGDVVSGAAWIKSIQKPEAMLGKRKRQRSLAADERNWGHDGLMSLFERYRK